MTGPRMRSRALPAAALLAGTALVMLALARGAGAADSYPAPAYFAGGLTAASSWEEILRTPGIAADFPHIGFATRFIPLNATCVAGGRLRPLDAASPGEGPVARDGGRYAISVYKVIPTSLNPSRVFLFNKSFDVPACPAR